MRFLVSAGLLVAGVIHLLPLSGVLGAERLTALYGVPMDDPGLVLLLRHRAVLFGALGVLLVAAAFRASLRNPAFAVGFVSVISFLFLSAGHAPLTGGLQRVVVADWIALAALAIAGAAHVRARAQRVGRRNEG